MTGILRVMTPAQTLAVAVIGSLATTLFTGLFLNPRFEARNRRIQTVKEARLKFANHLLTIAESCDRLLSKEWAEKGPEVTSRESRLAERERWRQQIDEATKYMIDHSERLTSGPTLGDQSLWHVATIYATAVRSVWLSTDSEADRLRTLGSLTRPVHHMFFAPLIYRVINFRRHARQVEQATARWTSEVRTAVETARKAEAQTASQSEIT